MLIYTKIIMLYTFCSIYITLHCIWNYRKTMKVLLMLLYAYLLCINEQLKYSTKALRQQIQLSGPCSTLLAQHHHYHLFSHI